MTLSDNLKVDLHYTLTSIQANTTQSMIFYTLGSNFCLFLYYQI